MTLPEMVSALQSQYILGLDNDGSFVWIRVNDNVDLKKVITKLLNQRRKHD
jgi:hypothetical protein